MWKFQGLIKKKWNFQRGDQSIQSMYFKERFKLYNLQIYIHLNILFLHDMIMIIMIMKTN